MTSRERRRAAEHRFIQQQRVISFKAAFAWFVKRLILFAILITYTVIGAYAFQTLESANELEQCKQRESRYLAMEQVTAQKLWSVGQSYLSKVDESQFDEALDNVRAIVQQYAVDVIEFNGDGYDGRNCSLMGTDKGVEYDWSLVGSMLFAITVYTTVGYGNIAPKTTWGRFTVIVYAMVGIPIMLMCVALVGEVMADVFRFVYIQLCCCGLCARRARLRRRQREVAERRRRELEAHEANRSIPPTWNQLYQEQMSLTRGGQQPPVVVDDYDDLLDEEDPTVGIPLTVTLLVIGGYILMGATLFGVWENWEPMEAAYFCFVTISTIGFGDVVPGAAAGVVNRGDAGKMAVDGIYIVLGLAMISMAFNLIQENMARKVKMLEDKLSGSMPEEHTQGTVPAAVAAPVVTAATAYDSAAPMPYKQPTKADQPPASGPGAHDHDETSFSDNRPSTSSSYHGARPKTPKSADDGERPDTRRSSMALPYIAE